MSNNNEKGSRGAHIVPSARPSIHIYRQFPFNIPNNMNRYGLTEDSDNNDSEDYGNEEGQDSVDGNTMSKLASPIGIPQSSRKKNRQRRNSFHAENGNTRGDDTSNVLSKSVPAPLPSQLYSSDDSEDEQPSRNEHQFSDLSYYSVDTPTRNYGNRSNSYTSTPLIRTELAHNMLNEEALRQSSSYKNIILYTCGIILSICASILYVMLNTSDMSNISTYDELKFYTDVSGFGEKYNVDENSLLQVQTGIATIFERQDTGSFMFLYNSSSDNFNPAEFNKFVNGVSFVSSKYLRNDSTPVHYTIVEGNKLDMEEYSELIATYREELRQTGVMLVRDVEAIPSKLAMAFHFYCDEYNPLVKKSAIFFTMNLAECPQESGKKSTHAVIEHCLSKKWNSLPTENISPLLTRVVSVVIDVTSAF